MEVSDISKHVFSRMGVPRSFSLEAFQKAFREELRARGLGKDLAQYRYLFGQVVRKVKGFVKKPPKNLPEIRKVPDFKRLAANDCD
ncbi:MAG: hypothetical protein HYV45_02955 [Candidatus Moranbacteria bacterium]|nr:hypothetical protein [Candidatus Moranbacteria bacterium]